MTRQLTYKDAVNEAIRLEMRADPSVILIGEDVAGGASRHAPHQDQPHHVGWRQLQRPGQQESDERHQPILADQAHKYALGLAQRDRKILEGEAGAHAEHDHHHHDAQKRGFQFGQHDRPP